jgi:uncharacterized protein (DUF2062 family)
MGYIAKLKDRITSLSLKGLPPQEIAAGIALGNFIGFIPLIGTHTVMAIAFASLLRLNTLIVLLGTQISNPLSFPFQIFLSAEVGNLILNGSFLEIEFSREIDYLSHYLVPILIGSLILGLAISMVSYFSVKGLLRRRKNSS